MHRIDTPTAQKDKFGTGKNGFTGGNPQTGELPTALNNDYFDAIQEELATIIEATDVALDKNKNDQILTALKALLLQKENNLSEIKTAGATAQEAARINIGAAALAGLATQLFSVATATASSHAINLAQLNAAITNLGLGTASKANVGTGAGQIPDMSSFISSNGQNGGYVKFPDGTIIQRGFTAGGVMGSPIDTAFPIPFTSTNYSVVATSDQAKPGSNIVVNFATQILNTAAFRIMQNTNTAGYAAYWIAIGK